MWGKWGRGYGDACGLGSLVGTKGAHFSPVKMDPVTPVPWAADERLSQANSF